VEGLDLVRAELGRDLAAERTQRRARGASRGLVRAEDVAVAVLGTLQTAMTADVIPAQDQNIVIGGLLLASVIVPNIGDIYRRGRDRLRAAGARRRATAVTQEEGT
jgi:hypothetical protein